MRYCTPASVENGSEHLSAAIVVAFFFRYIDFAPMPVRVSARVSMQEGDVCVTVRTPLLTISQPCSCRRRDHRIAPTVQHQSWLTLMVFHVASSWFTMR